MRTSVASTTALLVTSALLCLLASPAVALVAAARSTGRTTLSVLSFGAAADGVTDDAEVLEFYSDSQMRRLSMDDAASD